MAHARQEQPDRVSTRRQRLGAAIRSLRQQQGLTLSQLAAKAEVSVSYLSRLENGRSTPSFTLLARLANALGVDVDSFVTIEQEEQEIDRRVVRILRNIGIPKPLWGEFFDLSIEARIAFLTSLEAGKLDNSEMKRSQLFQYYDPQEIRRTLAATADSWQDIDTDTLIGKLYRARGEGSRPMSRP